MKNILFLFLLLNSTIAFSNDTFDDSLVEEFVRMGGITNYQEASCNAYIDEYYKYRDNNAYIILSMYKGTKNVSYSERQKILALSSNIQYSLRGILYHCPLIHNDGNGLTWDDSKTNKWNEYLTFYRNVDSEFNN